MGVRWIKRRIPCKGCGRGVRNCWVREVPLEGKGKGNPCLWCAANKEKCYLPGSHTKGKERRLGTGDSAALPAEEPAGWLNHDRAARRDKRDGVRAEKEKEKDKRQVEDGGDGDRDMFPREPTAGKSSQIL